MGSPQTNNIASAPRVPAPGPRFDPDEIRRALRYFVPSGEPVELRIPKTRKGTVSAYYTDLDALVHDAARLSGRAEGVYVTLNAVSRDLQARACNRYVEFARYTTSDADITWRHFLPIDVDPVRPAGISATDAEHELALNTARRIREWLLTEFGIVSILGDSGNGGHILVRIELPNDPGSLALIEKCLHAVASRFDGGGVAIDRSVGNAARIWKLYGTLAAKGDSLPDRPHRLAQLLEVPGILEPADEDQLRSLAAMAPPSPQTQRPATGATSGGTFDLNRCFAESGLRVREPQPWQGGRRWVLPVCPWNAAHTNGAAFVIQHSSGAISAGCHHDGCRGRDWHDLRDLVEPGWRDGHGKRNSAPGDADAPPARGAKAAKSGGSPGQTPATQPTAKSAQPRVVVRCLLDVEPEKVNWLWPGRIPLGRLTVFDGDPGQGKSLITVDLAARVSAALEMPDGHPSGLVGPGGVVLVNVEDGVADTIVPRLIAAGADRSRIHIIDGVEQMRKGERVAIPVTLEDVPAIEEAVVKVHAQLLIIDPLMAYIPMKFDAHTDQHMRLLLSDLGRLADRTGCAIVSVRHLNKTPGGNPLYRGGGSIGIVGIARSGMLVAPDPNDRDGVRRVLAMTKQNLSAPCRSLAYRIEEVNGVAIIRWDAEVDMTAAELLAGPRKVTPEREQIIEVLKKAGAPMDARSLASRLDTKPQNIRQLLSLMAKAKQIYRVATGLYQMDPPAPAPEVRRSRRQARRRRPVKSGRRDEKAPDTSHNPHDADNAHNADNSVDEQSTCEGCECCEGVSDVNGTAMEGADEASRVRGSEGNNDPEALFDRGELAGLPGHSPSAQEAGL